MLIAMLRVNILANRNVIASYFSVYRFFLHYASRKYWTWQARFAWRTYCLGFSSLFRILIFLEFIVICFVCCVWDSMCLLASVRYCFKKLFGFSTACKLQPCSLTWFQKNCDEILFPMAIKQMMLLEISFNHFLNRTAPGCKFSHSNKWKGVLTGLPYFLNLFKAFSLLGLQLQTPWKYTLSNWAIYSPLQV